MIENKFTPITILWIDDDPVESLVNLFRDNGFNVFIKDNYEDAISALSNPALREIYDAVILDVNSKENAGQQQPSMSAFTNYSPKIYKLCDQPDKSIPWFVLTMGTGYAGASSLEYSIPRESWTKQQYYIKTNEDHQQKLVKHIRELTNDAPNRKLRNRYPGIWACCDDKTEVALFKIIKGMDDKDIHNTSLFIDMRMVLGATVTHGKACGLLPDNVVKANEAKNVLITLALSDEDLVPSYISYNYAALCDTVNNGCHSEDENPKHLKVHPDVSGGKAPYLMVAAFNQLLTVLNWFGSRFTAEGRVRETKEKVSRILSEQAISKNKEKERNEIDEGEIKQYKEKGHIRYYIASKQIYELQVPKGETLPVGLKARIFASIGTKHPFCVEEGEVKQYVFNTQYEIIEDLC